MNTPESRVCPRCRMPGGWLYICFEAFAKALSSRKHKLRKTPNQRAKTPNKAYLIPEWHISLKHVQLPQKDPWQFHFFSILNGLSHTKTICTKGQRPLCQLSAQKLRALELTSWMGNICTLYNDLVFLVPVAKLMHTPLQLYLHY